MSLNSTPLPIFTPSHKIHTKLSYELAVLVADEVLAVALAKQASTQIINNLAQSAPGSRSFLLLGITHGNRMSQKMLKRQLDNAGASKAFVVVLEWENLKLLLKLLDCEVALGAEQERRQNTIITSYLRTFIDELVNAYPALLLGIVCDANLGQIAAKQMTGVVNDMMANHEQLSALRIFTGTPECQIAATEWVQSVSAHERYKLSSTEGVYDHSKMIGTIGMLMAKLTSLEGKSRALLCESAFFTESKSDFTLFPSIAGTDISAVSEVVDSTQKMSKKLSASEQTFASSLEEQSLISCNTLKSLTTPKLPSITSKKGNGISAKGDCARFFSKDLSASSEPDDESSHINRY